jgi:hypothetical protein
MWVSKTPFLCPVQAGGPFLFQDSSSDESKVEENTLGTGKKWGFRSSITVESV